MVKALQRQWEHLDISNDFIFANLMQDKEICIEVLSRLLHFNVEDIEDITYQKALDVTYASKGIRLDVYIKGDDNIYNVEMQVRNNKDLARRTRYYQAMIDLNSIEKGGEYADLPNTYIIFICKFDPFSNDLPCYSFSNICHEDNNLHLDDGAKKIFFNTTAYEYEANVNTKKFLAYINGNTEQDDHFIEKINSKVKAIKEDKVLKEDYMAFMAREWDNRRESFNEGKLEGKIEGAIAKAIEVAKKLLSIFSDQEIAKTTELPLEEVKRIRLENELDK